MPDTWESSGTEDDPLVSFNFGLELSGQLTAYFQSVSGIESTSEVVESKFVDEQGVPTIRKHPGTSSWADITLSRGVTTSMEMYTWRKMVEDGKYTEARRDGSIVMFDRTGTEQARWSFKAGWPSAYKGPDLSSDSSDAATEELTIAHEGIERIK
jgi:phage tail-like protein